MKKRPPKEKELNISAKDLEKIKSFRLLDNDFMTKVFEENIPAVELVLRIILQDNGLEVLSVKVRDTVQNLFGHSTEFDVRAKDANNVFYDIEIQREDKGAGAKRARYHSALLDANGLLSKGEDYSALPPTYVIFICERDIRGLGRPLYRYERVDVNDGTLFGDDAHIVYVNGTYTGEDDLGKLMSDFRAKSASEMHFEELAQRVRFLKETKEGQKEMCKIMEEVVAEREIQLIQSNRKKGMSDEAIADFLDKSLDYVQKVAPPEAAAN